MHYPYVGLYFRKCRDRSR